MAERDGDRGISDVVKDSAALLTVAGLLLYVALRLPTAIFYGGLGTSPEEVGLGYSTLLVGSTLGIAASVVVIALILLLAAFVVVYAGVLKCAVRYVRTTRAHSDLFNADIETMPQDKYDERNKVAAKALGTRGVEILAAMGTSQSELATAATRRRILARLNGRTPEQEAELVQLRASPSMVSPLRGLGRLAWGRALRLAPGLAAVCLIVTLIGLVVVAVVALDRVKDGKEPAVSDLGLLRLDADAVTLTPVSKDLPDGMSQLLSSPRRRPPQPRR